MECSLFSLLRELSSQVQRALLLLWTWIKQRCTGPAQNFPQFIVIHTVKGFGIVNKAEIDVFLELSCFFHDPADIGNSSRGEAKDTALLLSIDGYLLEPTE